MRLLAALSLIALASAPLPAQNRPPDFGQGWLPEFNHAVAQILALAEATPPEKYAWRPAPGIRSTSEVLMHTMETNYWLLKQAGIQVTLPKPAPSPERGVPRKDDVLFWLRASLDAVRSSYPSADLEKKVKFFGQDTPAENVFLRILVHNHEHMGQLIAYARMSGVTPPWSK